MSESIEPHYRTPRTMREARIDDLVWDHGPSTWRKAFLAALGLTLGIASFYWILTVL